MANNVTALFDSYERAEEAKADLVQAGFSERDIRVVAPETVPVGSHRGDAAGIRFGDELWRFSGLKDARPFKQIVESGGSINVEWMPSAPETGTMGSEFTLQRVGRSGAVRTYKRRP